MQQIWEFQAGTHTFIGFVHNKNEKKTGKYHSINMPRNKYASFKQETLKTVSVNILYYIEYKAFES